MIYNLRDSFSIPQAQVIFVDNVNNAITPTIYTGILKYWNGSVWTKTKIKTYDGTSFIDAVLKIYQDSTWKLIDTTGV